MLGYISSTRKKSCNACVKAKRRCDLGYPFCKRCFTKSLDCVYPNAKQSSVSDAEVIIRQTTPDLTNPVTSVGSSSGTTTATVSASVPGNVDPLLFLSSGSGRGPGGSVHGSSSESGAENWENDWTVNIWRESLPVLQHRRTPAAMQLCREIAPDVWAPTVLTEGQILSAIRTLNTYVPEMVNGSNIFVHRDLFPAHQPQPSAYQDSVALSALYLTKNPRNKNVIANSINAKITALINSTHTWSITEHLAAVQALTIYQIIRLFDPDLQLQAQAARHNSLLEIWAAHLWKRFMVEHNAHHIPDGSSASYHAWVFGESVRRTVMLAVFTRCAWSAFTKGGVADQVPVLARLPFTRDLGAWECDEQAWQQRGWEQQYSGADLGVAESALMAYSDLASSWTHSDSVEDLDPFGKLLLAGCRGGDDPRLLV